MFEPENFEDEPCDGCGEKPSVHMGHGSFSCQKCWEAQWCPTCRYSLNWPKPHVCKTPEEIARLKLREKRREIVEKLMYDYDDEWLDRLDPGVLGV